MQSKEGSLLNLHHSLDRACGVKDKIHIETCDGTFETFWTLASNTSAGVTHVLDPKNRTVNRACKCGLEVANVGG